METPIAPTILLIEDNQHDIEMSQEAIEEVSERRGWQITLLVSRNGIEALELLQSVAPDLILLDLNMPKMGGIEFLQEAKKEDSPFRTIPVVVLTTSGDDRDILRAYSSYCSCYIQKPVTFARFTDALGSLGNIWFNIAKLPPKTR